MRYCPTTMEMRNEMFQWSDGMILIFAYVMVVNLVAFLLYGIDKNRAKNKKWRISERTLLGVAAIGGSVGALLGMYGFRHKTKHWKFRILLPVFFMLHVLITVGIWYRLK